MPGPPTGLWSQLWRGLIPREQSFKPRSTKGLECQTNVYGTFSLRKNELQVDGCCFPSLTTTSAKAFFEGQHHLLQYIWKMPLQELSRVQAERIEYALHAIHLNKVQELLNQGQQTKESFFLHHPDLRMENLIVDERLRIRGIIDWEFTTTVPSQAFLPPVWMSKYSPWALVFKIDLMSELRTELLLRKELSPEHAQLAQDWDFDDDYQLALAYIFLDQSHLESIFYRHVYPRQYRESPEELVTDFFARPENKEQRTELCRQLRASEIYTQYLKDRKLFDHEEERQRHESRQRREETRKFLEQRREQAFVSFRNGG